jgi:uncharacterized protein involved in exopolysaccharide biosynthesis
MMAFNNKDINPDSGHFSDEQEVNLLEMLQIIMRRRALVIKICSGVALSAVIYSLLLPNIYSATAKVIPPQKDASSGLASILGQGSGSLAGIASGLAGGGGAPLYLGILNSRSVADAVIKRLDLEKTFKTQSIDDARKKLASAVKMQAGKDGILLITAEGKDPKLVADLANAFVSELGRKSVELNLTRAGSDRVFLEKRLELVKVDLKNAEELLRTFQVKNKAIKVEHQAAASIEGIARLKAEIAAKEVQLSSMSSYLTDENYEIKALKAAIANMRSRLSRLAGGETSSDGIPTVGTIPGLAVEYLRLLREVKTQEAIYEQLTKQHEAAKILESKDSSAIQVLDEAVQPIRKTRPKRSIIVIVATSIAFLGSLCYIFFLEYFQKISPEDRNRWEEIRRSVIPRKFIK